MTIKDDTHSDPFADLGKLRLSQDFASNVGVEKVITTVPVRRPDRQWFIRTHPSLEMRLETAVIELKDERETYLIAPELRSYLPGEVIPKTLITTISRQGTLFLWPIRLPNEDGRLDEWNRSAREAANMAQDKWLRLSANMPLGAYETFVAIGGLPDPEWPQVTFNELLRIAFKERYIQTEDHPVFQRLQGAI